MSKGRYGQFGGQYSAETLMNALQELETAYRDAMADPEFVGEFRRLLKEYAGRPSLLSRRAPFRRSRHAGIPEARGSESHRGSQDQQRPGAGAWLSAWAGASSPRRAPVSTASRRLRQRRWDVL